MTINLFRGLPHGHASASSLGRDDAEPFPVPVRPLDTALEKLASGRSPALIKIDVEGAERLVFEGASRTLASGPLVLLEVNHETSDAFGYAPPALLDDLSPMGERLVFRVEAAGLVPERDPAAAPHGTAWLVVPKEGLSGVRPLLA